MSRKVALFYSHHIKLLTTDLTLLTIQISYNLILQLNNSIAIGFTWLQRWPTEATVVQIGRFIEVTSILELPTLRYLPTQTVVGHVKKLQINGLRNLRRDPPKHPVVRYIQHNQLALRKLHSR